MKKVTATIKFEVGDCVGRADMRVFIKDALESWGGEFHPDDPLFVSFERVTVRFEDEVKP